MFFKKNDGECCLFISVLTLGVILVALSLPAYSYAGENDSVDAQTGSITRKQVLDRVLKENKELAALSWQVEAERAAVLQAGFVANPELDVEVENFGGDDEMSDFDAAEITVAVSQLVQLGGKRDKRRRVAKLNADAAVLEYETVKLEVLVAADQAFTAVLAGQQRLKLAKEQMQLAEEVLQVVMARVEAGKVSPIEVIKAKVNVSTTKISLDKARRQLAVNREKLAAFWSSNITSFAHAEGSLEQSVHGQVLPDLPELEQLALNHPQIKKMVVEVAGQQAEFALARAERIPDITVSGGVRQFEENNDTAFVAGISIPLMFFDRNQGEISKTGHNVSKSKAALAAAKVSIINELHRAYAAYQAGEAEAQALLVDVLPGARTAFEAVQEGYRQGKFNYLDVLDAQQTLFEVTSTYIDALSISLSELGEVRRLAGMSYESDK